MDLRARGSDAAGPAPPGSLGIIAGRGGHTADPGAAGLAARTLRWHADPMSLAARAKTTEAEYLAWDLAHEGRWEFVNGEILAMAGAGEAHDRIVSNLHGILYQRLRGGPCRVHSADMRVLVDETGLFAYPDLSVVCGAPELAPTRPPSLKNPTVLVEVLSASTEAWDRAGKLQHYRHRASVSTILLVDSRSRRIERYVRNTDGSWTLTDHEEGEVALEVLGLALQMDELYDGVDEAWAREAALEAATEGGP